MAWNKYFLSVCETVAKNSKCLSRRIGCIMVRDHSIISTGYNGPPRGVVHCDNRWIYDEFLKKALDKKAKKDAWSDGVCPRRLMGYPSGEGLQYCVAAHAERNCLINAARDGIPTKGAILYMNCGVPCKDCLIEIINAGIKEIVVKHTDVYDEESKFLITHADLLVRTF